MKRLFFSAFAALALFALSVPITPAVASAFPPGPVHVTADHTEKIVPTGYVIASTGTHDLSVPMPSKSFAGSPRKRVLTASLPGFEMKRGNFSRVYPVPWRF
jgi:hypothetical protein